jgi:hypothetical protein
VVGVSVVIIVIVIVAALWVRGNVKGNGEARAGGQGQPVPPTAYENPVYDDVVRGKEEASEATTLLR